MACLKGPLKGNNGSHSYQHVFRTTIVSHLIYTFHCIFSSRTLTFLGLCLRRDKTATLFLASPYQIIQLFKKYFRTHPLKRNRQYRCFCTNCVNFVTNLPTSVTQGYPLNETTVSPVQEIFFFYFLPLP